MTSPRCPCGRPVSSEDPSSRFFFQIPPPNPSSKQYGVQRTALRSGDEWEASGEGEDGHSPALIPAIALGGATLLMLSLLCLRRLVRSVGRPALQKTQSSEPIRGASALSGKGHDAAADSGGSNSVATCMSV